MLAVILRIVDASGWRRPSPETGTSDLRRRQSVWKQGCLGGKRTYPGSLMGENIPILGSLRRHCNFLASCWSQEWGTVAMVVAMELFHPFLLSFLRPLSVQR